MSQKLFLSYKRDDNKDGFVKKLYERLKRAGFDVWWDMQSMPHRQLTFLQNIRDAIAERDRVVLVGSKLAYDSDYVKAEFEYALSVCKPVHTIMRNDAYNDIPSELRDKDVPDFKEDAKFEASFEHLLRHLQDDIAPLGTIHGSRPALPAWYIERDNIMDDLENKVLIDSKQPVVVTSKQQVSALHGMGGIGKTTVASAFCIRCETRRYFTDGIFWVTLGMRPEITQRQADIGMMFGDNRSEYISPEIGFNRLQNLLANKKVLIVLDDVWEKKHVEAFRVTGNLNRVLMTSRSRRLVTQSGATPIQLNTLSIQEGIRLFDERLERQEDAPRSYDAIEREIIQFLNGHTLAVSLAAALLREEGEVYAPTLLQRLQKRRESDNPFFTLEMADDDKNENLELCLSLSYEELNEELQRRFRILGVLAPEISFTPELAQALWDDSDDEYTERALRDLLNAGLIQKDDKELNEQHTVIRAYAMALLKRENEYEETQQKYFKYVAEMTTLFVKFPLEEWYKLNNLLPHIFYVGDKMSDLYETNSSVQETMGLFANGMVSYLNRSPEVNRLQWILLGLQSAEKYENSQLKAFLLNGLGSITDTLGDRNQAIVYYNQALVLFKENGDSQGESAVWNNIGMVYYARGDTQLALESFQKSLALKKKIADKNDYTVINNIGLATMSLENYQEALRCFKKSLRLSMAAKDKDIQAKCLNNLGQVYERMNQKYKALGYYHQAITMHQRIGDKFSETISLYNISNIYLYLNQRKKAIEFLEKCVKLEEEINHPDLEKDKNQLELWRKFENEGLIK